VSGRALYKDIAQSAFGRGVEIECKEEHRGGRHSAGALVGEFDADGIICEIEAAQVGLVGLEEHSEIGAAASGVAEDGERNAIEAEVAKGMGKGGRKTWEAGDIVQILKLDLAGDGGGDGPASNAANRREAAGVHGVRREGVDEATEGVALDSEKSRVAGLADEIIGGVARSCDHDGARVLAEELVRRQT
jgi:hypothetical protein